MKKEDMYGGESLELGSPPNEQYVSYGEAINNAGFGKYLYDPAQRLMSQPVSLFPGGYGYNTHPNPGPQQYYMYPPVGLGSNPYMGQMYSPYQPNPVFQQPFYQQQQPQEITYFIKPVNFSGNEFLPSANYEEEIEKLKLKYWMEEQENAVKNANTYSTNQYYGYGSNYYGVPYYNPWQYNAVNAEVQQKITEMENEAKENRIQFNMNLSRLAHNLAGDGNIDESKLEEVYRGKIVQSPMGMTTQDVYDSVRFNNMVPFDNSQFYRDHSMAVSREHNMVISKDSDMQECFTNFGALHAKYDLEEEQHRRRNGATLYNSNNDAFKYFVRAKAAERYGKTNQPAGYMNTGFNPGMNRFPTLQESAKLLDDGTLNITCNFGSKMGQTYSVHNSQEAEYDKDRERFQGFINSIPGSIYLNNPNKGGD